MKLSNTSPVLRTFDEAKAREFYAEFLGFSVDWQHRFRDDVPYTCKCLAMDAYFTCQSITGTRALGLR